MANAYTTVTPKPTEELPGQGFQIILVAQGPSVKDRTATYVTHGKTFDLLDLRAKAIDFINSLNVDDDYIKQIQSIAGIPLDLTPIQPPQPSADDAAANQFSLLRQRERDLTTSVASNLAQQSELDAARVEMKAFYDKGTSEQKKLFDTRTRGVV